MVMWVPRSLAESTLSTVTLWIRAGLCGLLVLRTSQTTSLVWVVLRSRPLSAHHLRRWWTSCLKRVSSLSAMRRTTTMSLVNRGRGAGGADKDKPRRFRCDRLRSYLSTVCRVDVDQRVLCRLHRGVRASICCVDHLLLGPVRLVSAVHNLGHSAAFKVHLQPEQETRSSKTSATESVPATFYTLNGSGSDQDSVPAWDSLNRC